jgi:hypothetical protein
VGLASRSPDTAPRIRNVQVPTLYGAQSRTSIVTFYRNMGYSEVVEPFSRPAMLVRSPRMNLDTARSIARLRSLSLADRRKLPRSARRSVESNTRYVMCSTSSARCCNAVGCTTRAARSRTIAELASASCTRSPMWQDLQAANGRSNPNPSGIPVRPGSLYFLYPLVRFNWEATEMRSAG